MKFRGTITKVFPENSGVSQKTGNPWRSVEFIVEEDASRYPQKIMPKMSYKVDENRHLIKVGNEVEIDFYLGVNEWTNSSGETKYMNQIQCDKITVLRSASGQTQYPGYSPQGGYQQPHAQQQQYAQPQQPYYPQQGYSQQPPMPQAPIPSTAPPEEPDDLPF